MKRILTCILALALCVTLGAAPAHAIGGTFDPRSTKFVQCATGKGCSAAIDEFGNLWMWGSNELSQLGNGNAGNATFHYEKNGSNGPYAVSQDFACQTTPVYVMSDVKSVSLGGDGVTCAIKNDGSLWMWGANGLAELGTEGLGDTVRDTTKTYVWTIEPLCQSTPVKVMDNVVKAVSNGGTSAAIKTDGSLWMWGYNRCEQLGFDGGTGTASNNANIQTTPKKISDDVKDVGTNSYFSVCLKNNGALYAMGSLQSPSLGNYGTFRNIPPTQIMTDVAEVTTQQSSYVARKIDGSLWTGGIFTSYLEASYDDTLGDPTRLADSLETYSVGNGSLLAVFEDGTLYGVGYAGSGQLGVGQTDKVKYLQLQKIMDDIRSAAIAEDQAVHPGDGNSGHALAIKTDGTLWGWGYNACGAVGNGSQENVYTPTQIFVPYDSRANYTRTTTAFSDVATTAYYVDAVDWAVAEKVTTGTGDGTTFSPDKTCTTAEIVTFLYRSQDEPTISGGNPFPDVSPSDYFYDAARWAAANELIEEGNFAGNTPCTRASTMELMWRLAGAPDASTNRFTDLPRDADEAAAIAWAVDEGITTGTGDGTTFSPEKTCTRAEIVTFLYRAYA